VGQQAVDPRASATNLARPLIFRRDYIGFSFFFRRRNHLIHTFLNLSDLGMYFLDEVMFNLGKVFNSFPLFANLVQKVILFG